MNVKLSTEIFTAAFIAITAFAVICCCTESILLLLSMSNWTSLKRAENVHLENDEGSYVDLENVERGMDVALETDVEIEMEDEMDEEMEMQPMGGPLDMGLENAKETNEEVE